jgi:hypothetical protein
MAISKIPTSFFQNWKLSLCLFFCFTFVKQQQENSSISIRNINFYLSIEMSSTSLLIHQGMLLFQVYVHDEVLSIHICGIYDYIKVGDALLVYIGYTTPSPFK